ncbi:MAG: copper-binding protein, partial [Sphingomonas sp. 32-66-10]
MSGMEGMSGMADENPVAKRGPDPTLMQNASRNLWKLTGWKEPTDHGTKAVGAAMAGMAGMGGDQMSGAMPGMDHSQMAAGAAGMAGMDHGQMSSGGMAGMDHGSGGSMDMNMRNPKNAPGVKMGPGTGNMERYMWGFDGQKMSDPADPIPFRKDERARVTLVNDTMMPHPIHLHGHFFELVTGHGDFGPRKHTVNVAPGGKMTFDVTADAPGDWAFHCHNLYHMTAGMMRVVTVRPMGEENRDAA